MGNSGERSLEDYRAKRQFDQTPEPAGEVRPAAGGALTFCVQKHLASRLHYDFRLEFGGVLLSWAVPKGPSLDPRDKRLAMATEDHPVEYGDFEGVIPDGYGAGIILLWDRGTWRPEEGFEDVAGAMKKGQIKFRLDGHKLKGSWVLVRAASWARTAADGANSWLLIKHRDDAAGEEDITGTAPLSVKSGGDLADILAASDSTPWPADKPLPTGQVGTMIRKVVQQAEKIRGAAKR